MHRDSSYSVSLAGIDFGRDLRNSMSSVKRSSVKRPLATHPSAKQLLVRRVGLGGVFALATILLGAQLLPELEAEQPAQPLKISAIDIRPQWASAWVQEVVANDPAAKAIVASYVSQLAGAGYQPEQQGVWVSAGQYPVAESEGTSPIPAASLTKIATTLAALSTWGPDHRFQTQVGWQGSFDASSGTVNGDLVITGGDDPLFVWEEAIALGNALQQLGVRRVTGNLIISGPFNMNFDTSAAKSGAWLKQALNANTWNGEIETAYRNLSPGTSRPQLAIEGSVKVDSSRQSRPNGQLVTHNSLPLVAILKAMNIYSNNPMADQMANAAGGPFAVVSKVQEAAGVTPGEIQLVNGSGLGEANQMSPKAAVLMLREIHEILRSHNFTISDIFPVAGADGGTIVDRGLPPNAVVKTGSLAVVSALAGALPTQDKGIVWFSLINYGSGLDALRSRQDQVLLELEQQWGKAPSIPPELQTTVVIGQAPYQFGSPERNVSAIGQ